MLQVLIFAALASSFSGATIQEPTMSVQEHGKIVINIDFDRQTNIFEKKLFSISQRDSFSNSNLTLEPLERSSYEIFLNEAAVFDVSYKRGFALTAFMASPGDTVLIKIQGDSIRLSNEKKQIISLKDFNVLNDKRNLQNHQLVDRFLLKLITRKYVTKSGYTMHKKAGVDNEHYILNRDSLRYALHAELKLELKLIDSLHKQAVISKQFADWVRVVRKGLKVWILANVSLQYEGKAYASDFDEFDFLNDSLVFEPSGYYRSLLASTFLTGVVLKNNLIQFTKEYRGYDYRRGYDSSDYYLTGLSLDYVKFYCLSQIKDQNTNSDFKDYYGKFLSQTKNNTLRSYVKKYLIVPKSVADGIENDVLLNGSDQQIKVASLLKSGKVLYLDFWASWCKPCRDAMRHSTALRKQLAEKNIEFIYISIDTDKSRWLSANKQEGLDGYPNSFLLADVKEASLITKNKIYTIPRYMIISKKGEAINDNAPGPDSKAISSMLLDLSK